MSMGKRSIGFVMLVLVAGILVLGNLPCISAQSECKGDLGAIINQCKKFVEKEGPKTPPSQECCAVLKDADVPCLCKHITSEIEAKYSMEKAVYVARTCGSDVPAGTQCGSYTAPPAPPPEP